MSVNLDRIGWEDGTLVTPAKVTIGGTVYDVTPEVYSGSTPLSAENLKEMEDNTEKALRIVQGEELYNSSTGSNTSVTLSHSVADYNELEIFYKEVWTGYTISKSVKVAVINDSDIELSMISAHTSGLQLFTIARWHVNNATLAKVYETESRIGSGGAVTWQDETTRIAVTKVVGYK